MQKKVTAWIELSQGRRRFEKVRDMKKKTSSGEDKRREMREQDPATTHLGRTVDGTKESM